MTTILHKRGTGTPAADDLSVGEIALDTSAGTAYTKLSNGTVVEIGGSGGDSGGDSGGGSNGGGSGSTLTAKAKGDISDGRATVINSDGTVSGAGEASDLLQDAIVGARSSGQYITSYSDGYFISCPITKHNLKCKT